jgi:hypothetical protein
VDTVATQRRMMSNYWLNKKKNTVVSTTNSIHDIVFICKNKEMLKISPEGFFVEGRLVTDDRKVYQGILNWLSGINKV